MFNFDLVINRRGTGSLKWDRFKNKEVIPMWVADMDFKAPPSVMEYLKTQVDHGVFGYSTPPAGLVENIVLIMKQRYQWEISPSWVVWLPGSVTGINLACRIAGTHGDQVITMVPIYPPFLSAPENSNRELVTVPMQNNGGSWEISNHDLEKVLSPKSRLLLLCNPHNPTGRVFGQEELGMIAEFCLKNDLILCSDEIHCDLILDPKSKHLPIATIGSEIAAKTITLMAPSKTYNIPGLCCSFAIIPEAKLRCKFNQAMKGIVPEVNALGFTACLGAYRDGAEWLAELLIYLRQNRDLVLQTLTKEIPAISVSPIEATYLAWLDVRNLKLQNPAGFFEKHGVGLSDGVYFGSPGYLRLNFGCPKSILQEGLSRMKKAVDSLG